MDKENKTFQCGKNKTMDMKVRVTRAGRVPPAFSLHSSTV